MKIKKKKQQNSSMAPHSWPLLDPLHGMPFSLANLEDPALVSPPLGSLPQTVR